MVDSSSEPLEYDGSNTKKRIMSSETKEKMSTSHKETWKNLENTGYPNRDTKDYRNNISAGVKRAWRNRENNGYKSIVRPKTSEETKKKISEAQKERWRKIREALKQYNEKEETTQ